MPQQGLWFAAPPRIERIPGDVSHYAVLVDDVKIGEIERTWRGWSHDLSDDVYPAPLDAATALVVARERHIPRGKGARS